MKTPVFIIAFIAILFSGCKTSDIDHLLYRADAYMSDAPDSAKYILESVDFNKISSRRKKARYALLLSQAYDKCYIDVDNDSLIRFAVDYFSAHGADVDKAKTYYYYAVVKNNASDFETAIKNLVIAREHVEKTGDSSLKGLIYLYLGTLYHDQYSFEEAVDAYSRAAAAFEDTGNKANLLYAVYKKGLALNMSGDSDAALRILSDAKNLALEIDDIETALNIMASIGSIKIEQYPDVSSLQHCKREIFEMYSRFTSGVIPYAHYPIVGYIYFQEGKIDSARLLYTQYYQQQPRVKSTNVGAFAILSKIEALRKNYKTAWNYECSYNTYSDSINAEWRRNLIQNLERKYKTEYLEKSYKALESSHKYAMRFWTLIIVIILIMGAIVVGFYRRALHRKKREIIEYERYVEEGRNLYAELSGKYDEIKAHTNVQDERSQTLFMLLGNRIQSLKQLLEWASIYEKNTDNFYKRFKEHIKVAAGKNRELADDVIAIANLSCHGVIDYLYKLHPTLSRHELCYCGFICLGFSPESIRILYNHTNPYSIYTMRSKIRSKLGITNNSSLDLEAYIVNEMKKLAKTE
ncbi:MAG: tetratricopeptide repeat protein [Bacteroides cellulosilyticus]|nr:tetratricopeptide repeat protein [Bacteroides cellulosilyticus]